MALPMWTGTYQMIHSNSDQHFLSHLLLVNWSQHENHSVLAFKFYQCISKSKNWCCTVVHAIGYALTRPASHQRGISKDSQAWENHLPAPKDLPMVLVLSKTNKTIFCTCNYCLPFCRHEGIAAQDCNNTEVKARHSTDYWECQSDRAPVEEHKSWHIYSPWSKTRHDFVGEVLGLGLGQHGSSQLFLDINIDTNSWSLCLLATRSNTNKLVSNNAAFTHRDKCFCIQETHIFNYFYSSY